MGGGCVEGLLGTKLQVQMLGLIRMTWASISLMEYNGITSEATLQDRAVRMHAVSWLT